MNQWLNYLSRQQKDTVNIKAMCPWNYLWCQVNIKAMYPWNYLWCQVNIKAMCPWNYLWCHHVPVVTLSLSGSVAANLGLCCDSDFLPLSPCRKTSKWGHAGQGAAKGRWRRNGKGKWRGKCLVNGIFYRIWDNKWWKES